MRNNETSLRKVTSLMPIMADNSSGDLIHNPSVQMMIAIAGGIFVLVSACVFFRYCLTNNNDKRRSRSTMFNTYGTSIGDYPLASIVRGV